MNKTKYSLAKAQKAVEISSKIEGHNFTRKKSNNSNKAKVKAKS